MVAGRGRGALRLAVVLVLLAGLLAPVMVVSESPTSAAAAEVPSLPVEFTDPGVLPDAVAVPAETPLEGPSLEASLDPIPSRSAVVPPVDPGERFTPFSRTVGGADGSFTTEVFSVPTFRPTESGWLPLAPQLTAGADGVVATDALVPTRFGGAGAALVSLEGVHGPVTLHVADSDEVLVPSLVGGQAVFAGLAVQTDARFSVSQAGVKGELVLTGPEAPSEFRFTVSDPSGGLGGATLTGAGVEFDGAIAPGVGLRIPAPFAYRPGDEAADTARMQLLDDAVSMQVITAHPGSVDVVVRLDPSWLAAQEFPLVIDPSLTFTGASGELVDASFLRSTRNCGTSGGGCGLNFADPVVGAGTYTDSNYDLSPARSYFRADLSAIPADATVDSASFHTFVMGCLGDTEYLCDDYNYTVGLHEVTGPIGSSPTWDSMSPITAATPFASRSVPAYAPYTREWHDWSVTAEVQRWVNGTAANHGFVMRRDSEPSHTGGPAYGSSENTATTNRPYLSVTYTPAPNSVPSAPLNVTAVPSADGADVSWDPPLSDGGQAVTSYLVAIVNAATFDVVASTTVCGSCRTHRFESLPRATDLRARVRAVNSVGTGPAGTSAVFTTYPPPTVVKELVTDPGPSGFFTRGQVATYRVTVSNPATVSIGMSEVVDRLGQGLAFRPAPDGVLPVTVTSATGSGSCASDPMLVCEVTGDQLRITGFQPFAPGDSMSFEYPVLLDGAGKGCATLENIARAVSPLTGIGQITLGTVVCDTNLGFEPWWEFVSTDIGPQATAEVNVAGGNLVVQHTDATPVQAHGRLSYVLRRTYNSQQTTLASLPGSFGSGWTLSVGEASDTTGLGLGANELSVPEPSIDDPLPVVLVDRDGTRHTFTPRLLNRRRVLPAVAGVGGPLSPRVLQASAGANICVDVAYTPPPGVHLGMWRYLEVVSTNPTDPCNNPASGTSPVVLGFTTLRTDRLRSEFAATGQLLSLIDGAGVEFRYDYLNPPAAGAALGPLQRVWEPRSCPSGDPTTGGCRQFRFQHLADRTVVTDPAGRDTTYRFTQSGLVRYLTKVDNPDGTHLSYRYHGVDGVSCAADTGQLCSVSDPRGATTSFAYTPSPNLPDSIASFTDRRGTTTNFTYPSWGTQTDRDGQRRRYATIDPDGRVGYFDAGTTNGSLLASTKTTWDTLSEPCTQPDGSLNQVPCRIERRSHTADTPNQITDYTYNPEGRILKESRTLGTGALVATWGYKAQYWDYLNNEVRVFNDTITGPAAVTSDGPATGRDDIDTLFVLSDQTQQLNPRGNAAGTGWASYLTSYTVDAAPANDPNRPYPAFCLVSGNSSTSLSATVQDLYVNAADSVDAVRNSGLVCQEKQPNWSTTDTRPETETDHLYDGFGQRLQTTDPANRNTTYLYYTDTDRDLTGLTQASGWLHAVLDDTVTQFVAFGYDRAGNVVRTWDRNATNGSTPADIPGTSTAAAAPNTYTETLYGTGATALTNPWRYPRSSRDQLGNTTTWTIDGNGNVTRTRPPRGNAAGTTTFDTTATFDAGDLPLTQQAPLRTTGQRTKWTHDPHGNNTATTAPDGTVTTTRYDALNRPVEAAFTRGPWPADTSTVPPSCRQSTTADTPMPAGRIRCHASTVYDGLGNSLATADANGAVTTHRYDAAGRRVRTNTPRNHNNLAALRTDYVYDANGNVTVECPPRHFAESGATTCTASTYTTRRAYDPLDRVTTHTTARGETKYAYDAVGNLLSVTDPRQVTVTHTYDRLHRRTTTAYGRPGAGRSWTYDPAGNVTREATIGTPGAGTGADGARVVDGGTHPQSNPLKLEPGREYTDITLVNGGWISAVPYNPAKKTGGLIDLRATGTISICSTCGITADGLGHAGGAASPGAGQPGSGRGPGGGGQPGTIGGGGGGGGHAANGATGTTTPLSGTGGAGGSAYGETDLTDALIDDIGFGSGGGAGGGDNTHLGGNGGTGGGIIRLAATTIDIAGTITAAGTAGQTVPNTATTTGLGGGGGGGGSGGTVHLAATTITGSTRATARGGSGGSGSENHNGGFGAAGRVRIDQATSRVTLHSYDAAHRPIDTLQGATVTTITGGLPDADGYTNRRIRRLYDADSNMVGTYTPRAFTASLTDPDEAFLLRSDIDAAGRPTATYTPRYNTTVTNHSNDPAQAEQCATTNRPTAVAGVPAYPADLGVCATRTSYDLLDRPATTTLPTAGTDTNRHLTHAYTDDGLLAAATAPSPATNDARITAVTNLHDANGQPVKTTDPSGHQTTWAYTDDGLPRTTTAQPNGTVTHTTTATYNAAGQPLTSTDPSNHATTWTYTPDGLTASVTDPLGRRTSYTYDGVGQPLIVTNPGAQPGSTDTHNTANRPVLNTFSADGLLTQTRIPIDATTTRIVRFAYDGDGYQTSRREVEDVNGTTTKPGTGQHWDYARTGVVTTTHARATATADSHVIDHSYDPAGNPTRAHDETSNLTTTTAWYLDDLPRTVTTGPTTTTYAYNGDGRPTRTDHNVPGLPARAATHTYNDAGLAATSTGDDLAGTFAYTYDTAGRPVRIDHPGGQARTLSYHPDHTLAAQTVTSPGGATTARWAYNYDNNYRVANQTLTGNTALAGITGTHTYTYDPAGQLTGFAQTDQGGVTTSHSASYDNDSNRLTYQDATWTYRADNSLHTQHTNGTKTGDYDYDHAGRTTTNGCTAYTYDGHDRLTGQHLGTTGTNCTNTTESTTTYDALGRQHTNTQTSPADGPETQTLHYDGLSANLLTETGDTTLRYGRSPAGRLLALTEPAGHRHITDDANNHNALLTGTDGTIACAARWDPWANPIAAQPGDTVCHTGTTNNHIWNGDARRDPTQGTDQFGNRHYNPATASWLTPDNGEPTGAPTDLSIGIDPLTQNRYTYVNGDPVNLEDPTGHRPCVDANCEVFVHPVTHQYSGKSLQRAQVANEWAPSLAPRLQCAQDEIRQCQGRSVEVVWDQIGAGTVGSVIEESLGACYRGELGGGVCDAYARLYDGLVNGIPKTALARQFRALRFDTSFNVALGTALGRSDVVEQRSPTALKNCGETGSGIVDQLAAATCFAPLVFVYGAGQSRSGTQPGSRTAHAPQAIGPAGNPGALTSTQRAQYLFDSWHPATFPNRTQSINYHLAKHGNGRTAFEYTRDAQQFFSQNRNTATEVILRDGTPGLRIQTKVPLPGGGTNNVGGYWTSDGRLVTFWG